MTADLARLLSRIDRKDEAALDALYTLYSARVYGFALRVTHHPALAQEVTQDVFVKVWMHPRAYDQSKGDFGSWLITLTRYTAIDRLRREWKRTSKDQELPEHLPIEDDEMISERDAERLRHLIESLPEDQRAAVQLAYFNGLTHSEIAEVTGVPVGTIKTRLRLGLQKLKGLWSR